MKKSARKDETMQEERRSTVWQTRAPCNTKGGKLRGQKDNKNEEVTPRKPAKNKKCKSEQFDNKNE